MKQQNSMGFKLINKWPLFLTAISLCGVSGEASTATHADMVKVFTENCKSFPASRSETQGNNRFCYSNEEYVFGCRWLPEMQDFDCFRP